jgi:hypothetical protein
MTAGAIGFWSYVREDDVGDDGRILTLSRDIRASYRLQTAEDLRLFVDRESIQWGEEWEKLIGDAIAGTTFFIPLITPSYFQSNACRQELLKFVREADRLGLRQLLMPVYWVTVKELEQDGPDSSDEAIRAIATHQWQDLREVRLEERESAEYRKAVNGLAGEIAKRAVEVAETVDDVPSRPAEILEEATEDDGEPGILEILTEGDEAFEKLTNIMGGIAEDIKEVGEISETANSDLEAAVARGQGTKAALTITERYARQLSDPADRIADRGQEFAASMTSLDASMHTRLNILGEEGSLSDEHVEFLRGVEELAATSDEALDQLADMVRSATALANVSRSLRAPVRRMKEGLQGVLDGRAIIAEWGRRAGDLRAGGGDKGDVGT